MTERLVGKRIVVTAAAQGIGGAAAELFAREGAYVIATDINETGLTSLRNCETALLDVTDPHAILTFAGQVGAVDALFNCAGFVHSGTILECEEDDWEFSLTLNARAMYRMIRAILPAMIDAGGGAIVNMSSVASSVIGVPGRFVYGTSKAAVIGITKSVAADFVSEGIRCNAICPGTVQSPSLDQRLAETGDYDKARAEFVARQPMGRVGKAEEVAELALYLLSDASGFTTGQTHVIDGGWSNI